MVTQGRSLPRHPNHPERSVRRQRGSAFSFIGALLAIAVMATMLPCLLVSHGQEPPPSGKGDLKPFQVGNQRFANWPKPDVALVISGQTVGYLQPCGCSPVQLGGLARRYNFVQSLVKDRGWNVVLADVGDVPQASGPQALLKYKYAMMSLNKMGYTAVSFGKNELGLGLLSTLGEFALNESKPRILAANLKDREKLFQGMVAGGVVSTGPGPKIGFVGIVDPIVMDFQDPDVVLENLVNKAVDDAIKEFKSQPDLLVLLFQGKIEQAKAIAQSPKMPKFDVIVVPIEEEDPPAGPILVVGKTLIVSAGQRGRHVGVVGAFRTSNSAKPFDLRYQLVEIGPQYETPKGEDAKNPIHALLQEYAQRVKSNKLLAEFTKNPSQHPFQLVKDPKEMAGSKYVGSERCMSCHEDAYKVWDNSSHKHAYETLEKKAERPNLRQYDGECVKCHVTGFAYKSGFVDENTTANLKGVGCEACHGPASAHTNKPDNKAIYPLINPWKYKSQLAALPPDQQEQKKMTFINDSCVKCHDLDNSVNFKVDKYWKQIAHPTPPAAKGN